VCEAPKPRLEGKVCGPSNMVRPPEPSGLPVMAGFRQSEPSSSIGFIGGLYSPLPTRPLAAVSKAGPWSNGTGPDGIGRGTGSRFRFHAGWPSVPGRFGCFLSDAGHELGRRLWPSCRGRT